MITPKPVTTVEELCALELGEWAHIERLPEETPEGERIYEAKSGLIEFSRTSGKVKVTYRFDFRPDEVGVGISLRLVSKDVNYSLFR